ncbi:MAG TPA: hypothetical protein DCO71_03600, partial [Gammaproteobacteria bacterium]|nr:hypothetical protein [Gammaproteobacteria bacterium]
PDVVGDTLAVATGKITAANLVVGNKSNQSDPNVPAGSVISQNPAAGATANEGDAVDLVISTGPATVPTTVPDVVGDTLAVATGKITAANLVVGNKSNQSDPNVPAGSVISQNPAAGATANEGDAVDLVISTGPSGGDNVIIDGCDTGVSDPGGIQAGIDQCEVDASNHGLFVRCVAIFTKAEGVPQSDRKGIMKCAAHSSIDGGSGSTVPSSIPDNTGAPVASSSGSSQSSVAATRNVTMGGSDTGVGDSDGSIQARVDACVASATSQRKFVKCVGKAAKSLKRSGAISKSEKKALKRAAKRSGFGNS